MMKLRTRVYSVYDRFTIGTVVMTVSNKALIRWPNNRKAWCMIADLVVAQD